MAGLKRDKSTVLVIDGVPYSLVKEDPIEHNNVCALCDLQKECFYERFCKNMYRFCSPPTMGGEWFFKVDWDIADKQILDYLDFLEEEII